MIWQPITSASIAKSYRRTLDKWANITDPEGISFVDWQAHDFSMRGMSGRDSAIGSGIGHAASFLGSDTLPVIPASRHYYDEKGFIIGSVNATEHSIQCANMSFFIWDKYDNDWSYVGPAEYDTFVKLITEDCPTGILSIVADTINTWRVIFEFMNKLKNIIMSRNGKIVLRPDSSRHTPVEVISGYQNYVGKIERTEQGWYLPDEDVYLYSIDGYEIEYKGVVEALWDIFGGTISSTGYRKLDQHIGMLYGEANNNDRIDRTSYNLAEKRFASTNAVYGCGSVGYQYQTRDSLGLAFKGTYAEINGVGIELFKDPITDKGFKKSARGLLAVFKGSNNDYYLKERCTWDEYENSELKLIYKNGEFLSRTNLTKIRGIVKNLK
jgi:nicotinamide phosphoribosyltransferase